MHKKILLVLNIILSILLLVNPIYATDVGLKNTNISNKIIIEDDADLLTEGEERELSSIMEPLLEFGNVIFKTTKDINNTNSLKYIQNYYYSIWKNNPGVAFYIDMNARELCACATGGLEKYITNGKCDTIMDNVYSYASKQNYYKCASETFLQMNKLLNGEKIAESMKYICNAILSIMVSLFLSYAFFMIHSGNKKASYSEVVKECETSLDYSPINVIKTGTHRVYNPPSDSGGSYGGGSYSGGGRRAVIVAGGGGGFSGSGGSHRF